jgi:hypothetical protein
VASQKIDSASNIHKQVEEEVKSRRQIETEETKKGPSSRKFRENPKGERSLETRAMRKATDIHSTQSPEITRQQKELEADEPTEGSGTKRKKSRENKEAKGLDTCHLSFSHSDISSLEASPSELTLGSASLFVHLLHHLGFVPARY